MTSLATPGAQPAQAACYEENDIGVDDSCSSCDKWNGNTDCSTTYEGQLFPDGSFEIWKHCNVSGGSCIW